MVVPTNCPVPKRCWNHYFSIFAWHFGVLNKVDDTYVLCGIVGFFLKLAFISRSLRCASAISVKVRGYSSSSSLGCAKTRFQSSCLLVYESRLSESMSSSHQFFETVAQCCLIRLLLLTFVVWKLSAVLLTLGSYSNRETASATVLCMPLI